MCTTVRESPHSMGLMSHAALAQARVTREAFDEAFREHELPPPDADLPTAPASDVPILPTIAEPESFFARIVLDKIFVFLIPFTLSRACGTLGKYQRSARYRDVSIDPIRGVHL